MNIYPWLQLLFIYIYGTNNKNRSYNLRSYPGHYLSIYQSYINPHEISRCLSSWTSSILSARQQFHQARQRQGQPRDEVLPGLDSWRVNHWLKCPCLDRKPMGKLWHYGGKQLENHGKLWELIKWLKASETQPFLVTMESQWVAIYGTSFGLQSSLNLWA